MRIFYGNMHIHDYACIFFFIAIPSTVLSDLFGIILINSLILQTYENKRDKPYPAVVVHSEHTRIIVISLTLCSPFGLYKNHRDKSYRHLKSMHSDHMRITVISFTLCSPFGSYENYRD